MKVLHFLFLLIIAILSLGSLFYYNMERDSCWSPCDPYILLNPFGIDKSDWIGACITSCKYLPNPLFYIITDVLILTIIIYLGIIIYKLIKQRKKI